MVSVLTYLCIGIFDMDLNDVSHSNDMHVDGWYVHHVYGMCVICVWPKPFETNDVKPPV